MINGEGTDWTYGHIPQGYIYWELDRPDMSYEFDTFRVIKRLSDGVLAFGCDSGCSCPTPFQGFESFKAYTRLDPLHLRESLEQAIREWNKKYDGTPFLPLGEVEDFIREVLTHEVLP